MSTVGRWPPTRAHTTRVNAFPDPTSKDNIKERVLGPV